MAAKTFILFQINAAVFKLSIHHRIL